MNEHSGPYGTESYPSSNNRLFKEVMLKILVIGDYGVGKTSIVRRYAEGKFSPNYKMTIGAEFSLKCCAWDSYTQVNIQLWDIAGHERFGFMTRAYYKYASAAAIVFDVSRGQTFVSVKKWLADIREKVFLDDGAPLPIVILANKCDIPGVVFPREELDKLCRSEGIIDWFPTSAKDNVNIDATMFKMIESAMSRRSRSPTESRDSILLSSTSLSTAEHRFCCV